MPGTTRTHTETLRENQVEAWIRSLEQRGETITGMTQTGAAGGRVKVARESHRDHHARLASGLK